ncbi:hypothetical protein Mapa_011048 [Marchantia paleacea]|nr:hypothetical protein Mapa_011048 [Marchantia paleacea]
MAVAAGRVSGSWITETRRRSNCQSLAYGSRVSRVSCIRLTRSSRACSALGLSIRSEAEAKTESGSSEESDRGKKKKVVVVGAGWAGLGASHHLSKQGLDVTLLEAGPQPGGLVAGWKTPAGRSVEVGIHGTKLILWPVLLYRKTGTWNVFCNSFSTISHD